MTYWIRRYEDKLIFGIDTNMGPAPIFFFDGMECFDNWLKDLNNMRNEIITKWKLDTTSGFNVSDTVKNELSEILKGFDN